jgi:hypothetical protein
MIDLLRFCGEDKSYPEFLKPFSKGGYTYASDGHICVRVPIIDSFSDTGEGRHQYIDEFLGKADREYVDIPKFTLPQIDFVAEDENFPPRTILVPPVVLFAALGDHLGINLCYLSWIVNLPEPVISFPEKFVPDPVAFSFKGGHGLVMTMLK